MGLIQISSYYPNDYNLIVSGHFEQLYYHYEFQNRLEAKYAIQFEFKTLEIIHKYSSAFLPKGAHAQFCFNGKS